VTERAPNPGSDAAARASRRRWITFGEILTVIALAISGLTFYGNWTQRKADQAEKVADAHKAAAHSGTLVLVATNAGKRLLLLKPASSEQSVQDQHIVFPTALGLTEADTTGEPRIDVSWFEHALIKARVTAHMPDNGHVDGHFPVALTTRYLVDGDERTDVAIYDVGYSMLGGWFGSHSITLHGISLIARATADSAQDKLDARWARTVPAAKPSAKPG